MTLRLHESMINNLAFDALAGRTVYEEKVQATAIDVLGHLPEKMKGDEDGRPWAITFAPRQPISVTFADNGFKITLRGVSITRAARPIRPRTSRPPTSSRNRPKDSSWSARGRSKSSPVDEAAGRSRKTVIRRLLKKRFEKVFEPEILAKGMELSGRWKAVGKLVPVEIVARDGWLTVVWKSSARVEDGRRRGRGAELADHAIDRSGAGIRC